MLNTYIKNRGITKTIIHDNNDNNNYNKISSIDWDLDYDGDVANISLNTNTDGNVKKYNFAIDSDDLANLLNVPSVDIPLEKRLQMDFIEQPYSLLQNQQPVSAHSIEDIIDIPTHGSEAKELIIPLTIGNIDKQTHTFNPKKHRKHKTHATKRVYKKKSSKRKTKRSNSSSRRKSSIIDLL
jgi:hypothetical protein